MVGVHIGAGGMTAGTFDTAPGWAMRIHAPALFLFALVTWVPVIFYPDVPLWIPGASLIAAIVLGTRNARQGAAAGYLFGPVLVCAWGLIGIGWMAVPVMLGAGLLLILGGIMAGRVGITGFVIGLTLIPFFPASPLLLLGGSLPGAGLFGLVGVLALFALLELARYCGHVPNTAASLMALIGIYTLVHLTNTDQSVQTGGVGWSAVAEPITATKWGRWILIRDALPQGATAVLGESVFDAEDRSAAAFWCRAARDKDLILFLGVSEPYRDTRRGAVWRFDPKVCNGFGSPRPIYRAVMGIPTVTGTWSRMEPAVSPPDTSDDPFDGRIMICLEAFLPWIWLPHLLDRSSHDAPFVVLSNDTAFHPLPVWHLRHKSARAMAGLIGAEVVHAETTRGFLLKDTSTAEGVP